MINKHGTPISLDTLDPGDLALPAKFASFRREQLEACEFFGNSLASYLEAQQLAANGVGEGEGVGDGSQYVRFTGMCLPPGSGKSLASQLMHMTSGLRTVVLTPTKGLQTQYIDDFGAVGMGTVWGKANYDCNVYQTNCRQAVYDHCPSINEQRECTYQQAVDEALESEIYVTNYDWWIAANVRRNPDQVVPADMVDLLICDEAHELFGKLSNAVQVQLKQTWLQLARIPFDKDVVDIDYWQRLAAGWVEHVGEMLKEALGQYRANGGCRGDAGLKRRVQELDSLAEALARIAGMRAEYWVCEQRLGTHDGRVWTFDSIWPGAMAENRVWCGVQHVVLMSGTFTRQQMRQLNIKPDQSQFREWGRVFPAANTPIIHIPTMGVRYGADVQPLIDRTHRIIESGRAGRKGVIHTVSYRLQQEFMNRCRYSQYFFSNTGEPDSPNASAVFRQFCAAQATPETPAILVSPSFSTGWDLAGRLCEWQIIAKMAYLNVKSKLVAARLAQWPQYSDANAVQLLVQASLRASRFATDYCEVFVLDDNVVRLMARNRALAPKYFGYTTRLAVPTADPNRRAPLAADGYGETDIGKREDA